MLISVRLQLRLKRGGKVDGNDHNESVVQDLFEAEKNVKTLPQFANEYPGMDEDKAYDIQEQLVQKKCEEENTTVSGWKLGLTSKAKQQMMGVHEPSYGVLLKNMSLNEGEITLFDSFYSC